MIPTQNAKVDLPPAPVFGTMPSKETVEDRSKLSVLFGPTPLAAAFRYIQPSWRNYIMYVDMEARTGNEDARRYLRMWQSLPPKERNSHVPEQLCELAQIAASDLIRWISGQVWLEGTAATSMVLAFNKPRVLAAVADAAMDPENGRHAEMFLKASGVLSQGNGGNRGGGVTVPIYNMPVASSGSVALSGAKSDSTPVSSSGLRSMDGDIVELSRVMQHEQTGRSRAEMEPDDDSDEEDEEEDDDD